MDQAEAVENPNNDDQRCLPNKGKNANNDTRNGSQTNAGNENDGIHRSIDIAKI